MSSGLSPGNFCCWLGVGSFPDSPNHVCIGMLLGSIVNKSIGYIIELQHLKFYFKKSIALHIYLVISPDRFLLQCGDCFIPQIIFIKSSEFRIRMIL